VLNPKDGDHAQAVFWMEKAAQSGEQLAVEWLQTQNVEKK
jgi:hypothetical protein